MPEVIKDFLRPLKNVAYAFGGYAYDYYRFFAFSGVRSIYGVRLREYKAVKIYHRLEKSLSFRNRRSSSGWGAVKDFVKLISAVQRDGSGSLGFQERVGLKVVSDFCDLAGSDSTEAKSFLEFNARHLSSRESIGGVIEMRDVDLRKGVLEDPEAFFLSRYSVRTFEKKAVPPSIVTRALGLALKTPSVCNRQAWHVYVLFERRSIDLALSLQNGNAGFGHEIPCLFIIAADLEAFDTSSERYQHWIDGGMFAMNVINALHSLGLASCCLNWSKGPVDDLRLRKLFPIKDSHTIITMMAVGFAEKDLKVCFSARRPIEEVYTELK